MKDWNPWTIKIFLWLVGNANTEPAVFKGIPIQVGQLLRSYRKIIKEIKYPIQQKSLDGTTVEKEIPLTTFTRHIDLLIKERRITTRAVQFGTLITIKDYDKLCNIPLNRLVQVEWDNPSAYNSSLYVTSSGKKAFNKESNLLAILSQARDLFNNNKLKEYKEYVLKYNVPKEDLDRIEHPVRLDTKQLSSIIDEIGEAF
jgi:hypothetical protein